MKNKTPKLVINGYAKVYGWGRNSLKLTIKETSKNGNIGKEYRLDMDYNENHRVKHDDRMTSIFEFVCNCWRVYAPVKIYIKNDCIGIDGDVKRSLRIELPLENIVFYGSQYLFEDEIW